MKRPGACILGLQPGWNNQEAAHVTVSMVTALSNRVGPISQHWKIPGSLQLDFITFFASCCKGPGMKSLLVFNPFLR